MGRQKIRLRLQFRLMTLKRRASFLLQMVSYSAHTRSDFAVTDKTLSSYVLPIELISRMLPARQSLK